MEIACLADIAAFLLASQHSAGGMGGSPGQIPHLATTYAAVAAAVTAGEEALAVIDRQAVYGFLESSCIDKAAGGGFEVCQGRLDPCWEPENLVWYLDQIFCMNNTMINQLSCSEWPLLPRGGALSIPSRLLSLAVGVL